MFVVITGASRGIGYELVKQFLADNENTVLAVARSSVKLKELQNNHKGKLLTVFGDITKIRTINKISSVATMHGKHVHILIHNAGAIIHQAFPKVTANELRNSYEVNVFAPFFITQQLLPLMGKKTKSHIINIGSMGGFQGSSKFAGLSAYASSKSALAGLTECLAEELKEKNIAVNCLALGAVQTEMLSKAFPGYIAPVQAKQMASFIVDFAITGHQFFNGKVIPVSSTTP